MSIFNNYYFSSFFWSTFVKVLNAIIGFFSVPLLLGYYGKAEYGILGISTACNGYMNLLDLGMNTGAVKFFTQWKAEGRYDLISRVAQTNISFYGIISIINMAGLVALAIWGEGLFSVGHEQFLLLRSCLLILALFCVLSWGATTFNQLLIADMQLTFTMQVQSVISVLKALLIGAIFFFDLSFIAYFFLLTGLVATAVVPYAIKCKKDKLLNDIRPSFYWVDFKVVLFFSLSIFALSLFQMSATSSRPILLSVFALNGAEAVAEFKIIEVVPMFIIMICGTFSSIFLPKASEIISKNELKEKEHFAYKWTILTTVIANCLCFPFLVGSHHILNAYVGAEYEKLSIWLVIWIASTLLQIHSTPTNALVLAYGKTKFLVFVSGVACVISMVINALFAPKLGVGSAVLGYFVYIIINLCSYYGFYYQIVLKLSRRKILYCFLSPTICGVLSSTLIFLLFQYMNVCFLNSRIFELVIFGLKAVLWFSLYVVLLLSLRIIQVRKRMIYTKYDN